MLPIITAPNDVLYQRAKPILKVDGQVHALIEEMKKTLEATRNPEGVGLAAPQVGKSLQLFISKPTRNARISVFINPKIELIEPGKKKKEDKNKLEGCLSLPTIWGFVHRAQQVKISYLDENGNLQEKLLSGFEAIIMQHEFDHLEGLLFPKRVLEQKGKLYKSTRNKKGEDIFEEVDL